MTTQPDDFVRPRLVLVTTDLPDGEEGARLLSEALDAGDVASVIVDPAGRDPAAFQDFAERLVPLIQEAGAAAIVAEDTRCAGRVKADGIHVGTGGVEALGEALARFSPRLIVGGSGFDTRHEALDAGERMPDYIFFGKLGADRAPEPHRRNLELARWWSEMVEIPCIVQGGASLDSLASAIETRAEFVALGTAVFGEAPGAAVARANAMFDEAKAAAATGAKTL